MSEPGNVAQALRYYLATNLSDTKDRITLRVIQEFLDFLKPLESNTTLELRRFRSPEWTWAGLSGREGFVLFDKEGNVVDIFGTKMS